MAKYNTDDQYPTADPIGTAQSTNTYEPVAPNVQNEHQLNQYDDDEEELSPSLSPGNHQGHHGHYRNFSHDSRRSTDLLDPVTSQRHNQSLSRERRHSNNLDSPTSHPLNRTFSQESSSSDDPKYVDVNLNHNQDNESPSSDEAPYQQQQRHQAHAGIQRSQSKRSNASSTEYSEMERAESGPDSEKRMINENHKWHHYLRFKRRHVKPVPKERSHCPEHHANWLSLLTWQWMAPLMMKGYQRPLEVNDIWSVNPDRSATVLAERLKINFEKRRSQPKQKRPLLMALYDTFKFEFILGGVCQLTSQIIQVVNPFILRYLINFARDAYDANQRPGVLPPPIAHGIGLVLGITILQSIQSGCTNQFLYRGMMNGGQARGALISVIFDKAMTISGRAKAGGTLKDKPKDLKPGSEEEKVWFKKMLHLGGGNKRKKPKRPAGPFANAVGWSNGRILNLMSTDSYRVDQASGMFHMIWTGPIAISLTLILLLINITYSALAGFGLLVLSTPILGRAIRSLFRRRRAISKITDQRVSLTQEILQAVRFVKFFGWEESFLERLQELRNREIRSIQGLLAIRNGINAVSMSMPVFASMLSFITYSLSGHDLGAAVIFSSLALFNSLRLPLNLLPLVLGQVVDATASIERIQEFLFEEDATDESQWVPDSKDAIKVVNATFTWEQAPEKANENGPGKGKGGKGGAGKVPPAPKQTKEEKKEAKAEAKAKRLSNLSSASTLPPQSAQSNGNQSSGTSLAPTTSTPSSSASTLVQQPKAPQVFQVQDLTFSAKRNELIAVIGSVGSGKSSLLAALAGDMRKTEGNVELGASRAFCPQYAWIQNATVKENILFGKPYDRQWYEEVIEACALTADLDMLPHGDQTEIGEKGITVSGGQKQRLNIARAIYFNSDMVLMDDPLSAVDAHVGRHIMDKAICGLLGNKCRVLATHQLWVLSRCDKIIWMHEGRIGAFDTFDNLMETNEDFRVLIANNAQEDRKEKQVDEDEIAEEKKDATKAKKGKKPAGALMQAEERAVSSVSWGVYGAYIKAAGSYLVAPLVFILLVLSQGGTITTSLWLSWWTSHKFGFSQGTYIGVYVLFGFLQAFMLFSFAISLSIFGTRASKVMLDRGLRRVLRAPMSFFDTTPLGRITNRFSKDIDTMDNVLSDSFRMFFITMSTIISVFILIMAYYYYFAAALVPLMFLFVSSASFYRSSAREIKRHEAVLRSSVFAKFSEAVAGTSTIRAYGLAPRFSKTVRDAVDDMNSAYFLTYANQRWLSVRLDVISNSMVFIVGILVVTSRTSVNPATGGLVLSYLLSIVTMLQFTVRQLAEVENNMNSTERIHHYGTALDEEAPAHLNRGLPPSWPSKGEIEFKDVQMRYRPGLPLVLQDFNLHVKGGERIGVVGRTGAGKSSIMSTLFRLIELSSGSITVDGVDISKIGLADLRSRMAIIPQDPTLFKGTIRSNLDPFNTYDDLVLWSALRSADLISKENQPGEERETSYIPPQTANSEATAVEKSEKPETNSGGSSRISLDSPVEEEGMNFSLGQRQLMALARALVRSAQIIICDEATSSVDMETDQKIQKTMLEGFAGKTVLCIAHRLKTILNYDRIVVMDAGRVAEVGTPWELFCMGGIFTSMCDRSKIQEDDFENKGIDEPRWRDSTYSAQTVTGSERMLRKGSNTTQASNLSRRRSDASENSEESGDGWWQLPELRFSAEEARPVQRGLSQRILRKFSRRGGDGGGTAGPSR